MTRKRSHTRLPTQRQPTVGSDFAGLRPDATSSSPISGTPLSALLQLAPTTVIKYAALLLVFVVLGGRFLGLISDYSVNIFFSDQWDFNDATLFQHHSLWQMFTWQHGPHRQGVGALLEWLTEPLFRWNSRTESFLVGGIIAVAGLCALWLKRKLFGSFSHWDAIILLIFFSPLQYETLFVTANLAHGPLPLLLIVLYCLAWTCRHLPLRYGLVLTINFLTIYTGFGLLLGPLTLVLLSIDYWVNLRHTEKGRIYFVGSALLALVSLGSFFIGYKAQPAVDCFSPHLQSPADYARYAALMFAPFLGVVGIGALPTTLGAVAACALLAALILSTRALLRTEGARWTRHAAIAILTGYCLLFALGTAYGRLCLGLQYAQSSRYVIYLNLGLLGLYFSLLAISNTIARNTLVAAFCLCLLASTVLGEQMRPGMAGFHDMKQGWKNCYLALGDIGKCNQYGRVYPWEPESTHLREKLEFLKRTQQNLFADSK